MNNLRNLYQEIIIEHSQHPRNFRILAAANHSAEGYNPLCGDRLTLQIKTANGIIEDIAFQGHGCAIFTSSTSMMTEALKGKTMDEAKQLLEQFHTLVMSGKENDNLGKLAVFSGVAEFPMRVKCAILPWHTLKSALSGEKIEAPVTTE